jgi:hypothetical protein
MTDVSAEKSDRTLRPDGAVITADCAAPKVARSVRTCRAPHPRYLRRYATRRRRRDGRQILRIAVTYDVFCTRLAGHTGDHAAYTFRISKPETWPAEQGSVR